MISDEQFADDDGDPSTMGLIQNLDGTFEASRLPEITGFSPDVLLELGATVNVVVAFRFSNGHANYRVSLWDPEQNILVIEKVYGEIVTPEDGVPA